MKFKKKLELTKKQIQLLSMQPVVCVRKDTTLIYKDHIPMVSYYITKGEVQYLSNLNGTILNYQIPQIIGAYENLNYVPFKYFVRAKTDLYLKIVNRSLLNEMFNQNELITNNCI